MSRISDLFHQFLSFFVSLYQSKRIILSLAKQDFTQRFLGNYFGILWAFAGPLITVLIMWFVFQVGFRTGHVENFPFILWLVTGMFPWFFLTESISSGTGAVIDKPYLVKKVLFRVSTLPVIKLLVAAFLHSFFILILFSMFALYGYYPKLHNLQVLYYAFATIFFTLGLSWATSAIVIFFRDLSQIISIFIQFGFWLTPIFWSIKMVPEKYLFLIQLNPAYYIVEGYRDSFLYGVWFWEKPVLTLYYWSFSILLFILGAFIFRRLRPHFADVL